MSTEVFVKSSGKKKLLFEAIFGNYEKRVRNLVNSGINVNCTFENGTTPLILAIEQYKFKIAKYLIDKGAKINFVCKNTTPLILAIKNHENEVGKYLINKGADVNLVCENESPLFVAIHDRATELAKYLIDHNANINFIPEELPALDPAIGKSSKEDAKYSINNGTEWKHPPTFLIDYDIYEIEKPTPFDKKNAKIELFSKKLTLLHLAIEKKDKEIAKYLIDRGMDINAVCDGESPLYRAIDRRETEIAKYLIDRNANIHFISNDFTLPLLAFDRKAYKIEKDLVDKGVDVNRICVYISPLYLATDNHAKELGKFLSKRDAETNFTTNGCTLLQLAVRRGNDEIVKYLIEKKGLDVNDALWKRPSGICICTAIVERNYRIAKNLKDRRIDVNAVICKDKSPLYLAIENNRTEMTKYLIDKGADVNDTFNKKRLLEVALKNNFIVEYLLIAGFDVNTKDGYGKVAADYLNKFDPFDIVTDTIKQHIVKLIAANFYMCDKNRMAVAVEKYDSLLDGCAEEVEMMKQNSFMESTLTYYELLHKPLHKSALKLKFLFKKNSEAKYTSSFSDILLGISSYKNIIQYRLGRALERAKLLVQVDDFVIDISRNLLLDPNVVREVLQYLTYRDLKLLCNSS